MPSCYSGMAHRTPGMSTQSGHRPGLLFLLRLIRHRGPRVQISWDPLQFDLTLDQFPVVQVGPGATGVASSLETYNPSFPSRPERTLTMVPVQMHWHVVSEHSVDGRYVRARCSALQQPSSVRAAKTHSCSGSACDEPPSSGL